jgi:hypothetical protein
MEELSSLEFDKIIILKPEPEGDLQAVLRQNEVPPEKIVALTG